MTTLAWWETLDEWAGVVDIAPDPLEGEVWRRQAVCAGEATTTFFLDRGDSSRTAKELCETCPVIDDCLRYALDNSIHLGIWGGTTERDRRRLALADGEVVELEPGTRRRDLEDLSTDTQLRQPDDLEPPFTSEQLSTTGHLVARDQLAEQIGLNPEDAATIAQARAEHQEEIAPLTAARQARRLAWEATPPLTRPSREAPPPDPASIERARVQREEAKARARQERAAERERLKIERAEQREEEKEQARQAATIQKEAAALAEAERRRQPNAWTRCTKRTCYGFGRPAICRHSRLRVATP